MKDKKKKAKTKVAKKESTKQEPLTVSMTTVEIETTARLGKVVIKPHRATIELKGMDLRADQVRRLSIWTKENEPLFLTINGEISTKAKVGKFVTSNKGEEPEFTDMVFSGNQCGMLASVVKSETEVDIKIVPDTKGLFEKDENEEL